MILLLRRTQLVALVLMIAFPLLAPPAFAQTRVVTHAALVGRIVGPEGAPVPGVVVFVRRGGTDLALRVVTDSKGAFRIEGVPVPGTYQVMASLGNLVEAGPTIEISKPGDAPPIDMKLVLRVAEQVSVTADSWTMPVAPPNSIVSRTASQLRQQNLFNPEDSIRSMPSMTIRKRYIGDRNGLVGGRSFGTLQPSRALVYLEGYLLSNFLGRFDAPRWNMVTPEALERVDVLYGPFSAVHAGNSIGTTIIMTERTPTRLEWGARVTRANQTLTQYGEDYAPDSSQISTYVGGRIKGGLWAAVSYNHQDSTSQPMQFFAVTANDAGQFPAAPGAAVPVTGIVYDTDPKNLKRALFGASGGAIDHTKQDSLKARLGYTFARHLEVSGLVAGWQNDTANSNTTFLRDAGGGEVWQGRVTDGVNTFNVPATALAPSVRDEKHRQLGITVRSRRPLGWNASLIASEYRILDDASRQANSPDPVAAGGGVGTVTHRDGTGWTTLEAQAIRTPSSGGRHTVTFGAHRNAYLFENLVNNSTDWRLNETNLSQLFTGRTAIHALYGQDVVRLTEALKLTVGWRAEHFETWEGSQVVRVASCTAGNGAVCLPNGDGSFNKSVAYPRRTLTGQSPKASLTWIVNRNLLLRSSYGRGVRFPNVEELYNGTVTATSVIMSDPNLRAERANAVEISAETYWTRHVLRTTFFYDDIRDAILRQSDTTVTPSVTNVSNVDRVRTPGLEIVWVTQDFIAPGLSVDANLTLADSKIVENAKDPASVGKYWLRVPKTRGNVTVAYRPTEKWLGSVGYRHQGKAYNDVYNLDVNGNVYGGFSTVDQMDLRVSYKPIPKAEIAFGIDNVTNSHSYQSHPLPGRTLFMELRVASR
jgi:iron complex outermembrane receptor protein